MSFSRLRPAGRALACLLIASGLFALPPAYAKDDGHEETDTQAEHSDADSADDSGQEDGRQDRSGTRRGDAELADEADTKNADSEDDAPSEKAEAPSDEPATESADSSSKPEPADAEPVAAPQKPVASERALPKEVQSKDASGKDTSKAEAAPSVTPPQQAAQPAPAKSSSEVTVPSAPQHDVYSERTDKLLKAESKQAAEKVHPMELRYPDHNVVVCTAGCGPGGTVVHKRPKSQRGLVDTAVMVPSAASVSEPPVAASSDMMSCLAGCFTTPKTLRAIEKRADLVTMNAPAAAAAVAEPSAASPAAIADKLSGKWTSAPASAAQPPAKSVVPAKSGQPAQMGSGDWMNRINSDRE